MRLAVLLALTALGSLAAVARRVRAAVSGGRVTKHRSPPGPGPKPEIRDIIEREAAAQGIAPEVALLFAELESSFNPNAFGDRDWAAKHPREWEAVQHRMPLNPTIHDPSLWGSYGLFGLLAAYHVEPNEHPHMLFDPALNAQRGVAAVRHALERAGGDLLAARLLYVGCGADGSRCSPKYRAQTEARLRAAAQRWLNPAQAVTRTMTPTQGLHVSAKVSART